MKPTPQANLIQAATAAGLVATPRRKHYDDHDPEKVPVDIVDPATGRAIVAGCNDYRSPNRWRFSPTFPRDSAGQDCSPPGTPPTPTAAQDTPAATLARRLRRYFDDFAPLHQEAETRRDARNEYHAKTAASLAQLLAAGALPPGKHDREPFTLPRLPGGAYSRENRLGGDSVALYLEGLSVSQACAILRALIPPPVSPQEFIDKLNEKLPRGYYAEPRGERVGVFYPSHLSPAEAAEVIRAAGLPGPSASLSGPALEAAI